MKRMLFLFLYLLAAPLCAQIDREGEPLTWQIGFDHTNGSIWKTIPALDIPALLAEDAVQDGNKSVPMRFAKRVLCDINLENSGRWTNLNNGDRIWMCGIEIEEAYSLGFSIQSLRVPEGGSVYFYTSDKSDFIGPLNRRHNTEDQPFITPPVSGKRIVIEYYEPHAFRGAGLLQIEAVAAAYIDVKHVPLTGNECFELLSYSVNNTAQVNASSAVLMSIVDDGQRLGTSVLLNNTASNGIPYIMTAQSMLLGLPSRWLFLFDIAGSACTNPTVHCWNKAVCGGLIKDTNPATGVALVRLKDMPRQSWSAFYSGWQTEWVEEERRLFLIQHAFGLPQSLSEFNGQMEITEWQGITVAAVDHWNDGGTFRGSMGSPLFDEELNLVGIQIGGDLDCDGNGKDYFAMLSNSWESLKEYLDPFVTGQSKFDGVFPILSANPSEVEAKPFEVFPNPAKGWVYLRNMTDEPVRLVEVRDGIGRLVDAFIPLTPSLDISSLPDGIYFLQISTDSHLFTHRLLVR